MKILKLAKLRELLQSDSNRLRMWATYQLIENHEEKAGEFVAELMEAKEEEIRESGIYLAGKYGLESYEFTLLGNFQRTSGALKRACAIALSNLESKSFQPMLWRWIEQLQKTEELNIPDLQCAAECWLNSKGPEGWMSLDELLQSHDINHLKSLTLFEALCSHACIPHHYSQLIWHYSFFRKYFPDPQFSQNLLDAFNNSVLLNFLLTQKLNGTDYRNIFLMAAQLLKIPLTGEAERILNQQDVNEGVDSRQFLAENMLELMKNLPGHEELRTSIEYVSLESFLKNICPEWDSTILKMQEMETLMLHALPLNWLITP